MSLARPSLPAAEPVVVWWDRPERVPERLDVLSDHEIDRASRLPASARRDYLAAHVMVRTVLEQLGWPRDTPLTPGPCPLCGGPHGRPGLELPGAPELSLTHADGLVAVALCRTPVGVDAERVVAPHVAEELVTSLHPAETDEVLREPRSGRAAAFTRRWARTEAYLKALGTGLGRAPELDYVGTDPDRHPEGWSVEDVAVSSSHRCAVAVQADRIELTVHRFGTWRSTPDSATRLPGLGPGELRRGD